MSALTQVGMLHASATGTPFGGRLFGMSSVLVAALRVAANVDLAPALISGPPQSSLASCATTVECALTPSCWIHQPVLWTRAVRPSLARCIRHRLQPPWDSTR